jgi:hypothetical protein
VIKRHDQNPAFITITWISTRPPFQGHAHVQSALNGARANLEMKALNRPFRTEIQSLFLDA